MSKETMKLALEALENAQANVGEWWPEAIAALREALAEQPAQQEPVAWIYSHGKAKVVSVNYVPGVRATPLYTSPPAQRTWVGLTDDERLEVAEIDGSDEWFWKVCKAIEAKLREKNS